MDTDKLIAHSRSRFDHAAAKRTLKEKYQGKLVFAHNGGMFKAEPNLIVFLESCWGQGQIDPVIIDLYGNPVKVHSTKLLNEAMKIYKEQTTAWLKEYEDLNKNR